MDRSLSAVSLWPGGLYDCFYGIGSENLRGSSIFSSALSGKENEK
jgi:hypothetical protein